MRKLLSVIICLLCFAYAGAQQPMPEGTGHLNLPLSNDLNYIFERQIVQSDSVIHTGMRPYVQSFVYQQGQPERYGWHGQDEVPTGQGQPWFWRKIRHESLVTVQDKDDQFWVAVDPVFNFEFGEDVADTTGWADSVSFYKNTRGFRMHGHIGEKFSFFSSFYENQAIFPRYQDQQIRGQGEFYDVNGTLVQQNGVVPGQGRTKQFKRDGFDYAMASGYVSFTPISALNVQLGTGKHFVGEGYRSLLLSDNTFNYPYLRTSVRFLKNKFQYTSILSSLSSLYRLRRNSTAEALYQPKAGTFHYLTYQPHRAIQLGLFEGVIWQRWEPEASKPINAAFFVPVLGFNSALYGLEDDNNALLGLTFRASPLRNYVLYGQYMLDGANKNGWQLGAKAFDAFSVKNLFLQAEYNTVAAFSYAHDVPLQNYSHYNQALAHPLGAGFNELVLIAQYRWKDLWASVKTTSASYKKDLGGTHLGTNIFESDLNATDSSLDNGTSTLVAYDLRLGFLVNPASNMNIIVGMIDRTESGPVEPTDRTRFIYAGFRTSLTNAYYDF